MTIFFFVLRPRLNVTSHKKSNLEVRFLTQKVWKTSTTPAKNQKWLFCASTVMKANVSVSLKLNAHSTVQHFKRWMLLLHQWFRISTQSWLKFIYFTFKRRYPFCITLPWAEGHTVLMDAMHIKWETLTKKDQ